MFTTEEALAHSVGNETHSGYLFRLQTSPRPALWCSSRLRCCLQSQHPAAELASVPGAVLLIQLPAKAPGR